MVKQDARVTRTKSLIRYAFLQLLKEKNYEAITVQDILDKTLINRSTFYKHFLNKSDVAKALVNEIKYLLITNLEHRFDTPTLEFIQNIHPLFWQNRELVYLIGQIETPKIHLYKDIHQIIKREYIQYARQKQNKSSEELDFQGHLFATTTLGMMRYFIEKNKPPPPDPVLADVNEVFNLLIIDDKKSPSRS